MGERAEVVLTSGSRGPQENRWRLFFDGVLIAETKDVLQGRRYQDLARLAATPPPEGGADGG